MIKIGSQNFNLFLTDGYNHPHTNERMVEIPLAKWFIERHKHDVIEVGAVMPYYDTIKHEVVDPTDPWPWCTRKSVSDFSYESKKVLSISTVEHVGFNKFLPCSECKSYDKEKSSMQAVDAVELLRRAMSYLITWPAGYHTGLDEYVTKAEDVVMLKRIGFQDWIVVPSLLGVKFMDPWYCGNGLFVLTNCKELHH